MTPRRLVLFLAMALAGCPESGGGRETLRVLGRDVVLEGTRPLRGLELDLAWDAGLAVDAVTLGADAERMNLFRVDLRADGRSARVVLTDLRKLRLPVRGSLLHIEASGDGEVRIVRAVAAGDAAEAVPIEVLP